MQVIIVHITSTLKVVHHINIINTGHNNEYYMHSIQVAYIYGLTPTSYTFQQCRLSCLRSTAISSGREQSSIIHIILTFIYILFYQSEHSFNV